MQIRVSFKKGMLLLGPTYGGATWISPPAYGPVVQIGSSSVIEARAEAIDARGLSLPQTFNWTAHDPEMVVVSSMGGNRVAITVKRPGESRLLVSSPEGSRELTVRAERVDRGLRVVISQHRDAQPAIKPRLSA